MIDVAAVAALLAPALPYLLKSAEHAASQAATAIGDKTWEYAQRVWDKLSDRLDERPGAREAAEEVAADPADEDAQHVLVYQLRKLLERDGALAAQIDAVMSEAAQHVEIRICGDRNVTMDDVVATDTTIVTGDGNTVGRN
ncbi:MAG: hypothetical protein M3N04_01465 [Actinomycetota bacterium]|nr:hypothetical protein [Actinomycetota bacterium]MDP8967247.1 hypothetical protein [Actinomycetota bacterium]